MKRTRQYDDSNETIGRSITKRTEDQPSVDYSSLQIYISDKNTIDILNKKGIKSLFKIQQETYFDVHNGLDVLARDRTGSGKTIAYSLPIIQRFRKKNLFDQQSKTKMLVILPTRELAVQVAAEIESLKHHKSQYKVAMAFGGANVMEQRSKIECGCDFLVATPGRLWHFLQNGYIKCQDLCVICFDEADQMLKMGFKDEVDKILRFLQQKSKLPHQTLLFSATLPQWIVSLSKKYLKNNHKVINMIPSSENSCSTTIKHYKLEIQKRNRASTVKDLIFQFVPKQGLCIIFCQTKRETTILQDQLSKILKERIQTLSGDVTQQKRLKTFSSMKKGSLRFIVATNVAARGLDIPNVQMVIQCSPPKDVQYYIHRAGRTGRAGKQGVCIMLYGQEQGYLLNRIESEAKISFKKFVFQNKVNHKEQQNSVNLKTTYVENNENKKVERFGLTRFKICNWRKPTTTSMELSRYIQSIVDVCDVTTKLDDTNKEKGPTVVFEVPATHENYIVKLYNQFKTDGYLVEKLSESGRVQRQY